MSCPDTNQRRLDESCAVRCGAAFNFTKADAQSLRVGSWLNTEKVQIADAVDNGDENACIIEREKCPTP